MHAGDGLNAGHEHQDGAGQACGRRSKLLASRPLGQGGGSKKISGGGKKLTPLRAAHKIWVVVDWRGGERSPGLTALDPSVGALGLFGTERVGGGSGTLISAKHLHCHTTKIRDGWGG